jgi:ribonuclease BN (tRNA processing enzyme)
MRITIAGSGGAAVTKERSCPGILIDGLTLVDCGSGSLKNLRVLGVDLALVERVLLSHLHNDHVGDLSSLLWTMQIEGRQAPLAIRGPLGTVRFVDDLLRLVRTPAGFVGYRLDCRDLIGDAGVAEGGGFSWCRGEHVPESLAYRLGAGDEGGGGFCVSGDTRPLRRVAALARGADLLVHDSSFPSGDAYAAVKSNHSTAAEAGDVASWADAGALMLFYILGRGHPYEETLIREASERFRGKVVLARDMMVLDFP